MRYELFLRRPSGPLSDEELQALREALGREEGADLALDPYRSEEGALLGVDIGVALDRPAGAARLCRLAFAAAAEHGLSVYDPQLGRSVGEGDEDLVQQRFDQGAAFSMAAPVSTASDPAGGLRLSPTVKLWLVVLGAIVLVLLASRCLTCQ
jgi:hypothetical protein